MLTSTLSTPLLNKVMDKFSQATHLACVAVDINGTEISEHCNFTPFCQKMRSIPKYRTLCQKCGQCGGLEAAKTGKPFIYRCHAGLIDFSVPLVLENQLVGFLSSGQVISEDQSDISYVQDTISSWHQDQELMAAYRSVPSFSLKKILAAAELLMIISDYYLKAEFEQKQEPQRISTSESEPAEGNKDIKKAIKYIHKNLNRQITLEEVSQHVYLSPYYFSKLFKQEMGVNFINYVNRKKMERAKELLRNPNWSIDNIAKSLGYSQTSYFCKVFRKEFHTTPRNYRNLYIR
ncbi:MAG: PocR ligand-binding domain-containing protein [Bacillus sp. (in: firmicutes)]